MKTHSIILLLLSTICAVHAAKQGNPRDCQVVIVGAGVGGIYSAYRLTIESKSVPPSRVCIFEALPRAGGRILTLKSAVPTFENFTIDLGAYRYGRHRHFMMRGVIEDVLGYEWGCYTDPLARIPVGSETCPADDLRVFSTRGSMFGVRADGSGAADKFETYSRKFPYRIPKPYQWGPGNALDQPRSPSTLLVGPDSVLPEISSKWPEFEAADYKKAMKMTDEILAKVTNGGKYKSAPYHQVSLWQLAREQGFSSEELKYYLDRSGPVTPYTLHTNVERLVTVLLRTEALKKFKLSGFGGLVVPVEQRGGRRRRTGMNVLYKGLLEKISKAGVRVFYNHRITRINRVSEKNKNLVISMKNGKVVWTKNLIINSAKTDIEALGIASEPVNSADENTKLALARILPMPGTKAYCFWDDAWWVTKLNQTSGSARMTGDTLYQTRYHDGDVVCEKNGKCRGALLVSYASGAVHSGVPGTTVRAFNQMPYVPSIETDAVIRLVQGEMTAHQKLFFAEIHKQLRMTHRSTFEALGFDKSKMWKHIPLAKGCMVSDFREYGHQVDTGAGRGGNDNRRFSKPVQDLKISMVNEGWSEFRGWAEGSLISAERALYHNYGLTKPQWMDDLFHKSVIKLFNRGRMD